MMREHSTWGLPTSFRSWFRPWRGIAALGLAAALAACAQQPAAKTAPAAATASSAASPAADAGKPAHRGEGMDPAQAAQQKPAEPFKVQYPQPPDGKWLQDAQGRQYFEQEVPKVEGTYLWLDPEHTRIRLRYGETYDVASEGDKSFKVKVYRVDQARPEGPAPAAPTAADRERVAAGYKATPAKTDRLSFQPFNKGLPAEGQWRNGFDIADMNGDGHPDIVFSAQRKGRRAPNIFLGDGHGAWRLWTEAKFPGLPYDYGDAAVADFNGDGQPDLALGVHLRGILAVVSDGPGRFKEWGRGLDFQVPGNGQDASGFSSRAVAAVDWNGDGRPDIVALGEGPRFGNTEPGSTVRPVRAYGLVVYLNQGDGSWKRLADKDDILLFGDDLAVGDLDGDGHPDAVLGSNVMGDRGLVRWGKGGDGWEVAALEEMRPDGYLRAVRIADFNQDGKPDLLVGYTSNELGVWRSGIDLLLNLGDRKWRRQPVVSEDTREGVFALGAGDLDGDGKLDVAALTGNGDTWVFLGDGTGTFRREETPEIAEVLGGCRGYGLRLADLDGDGKAELVSAFAGEASAMFAPDHCPNQGSLTAWKPQPKTSERPAR